MEALLVMQMEILDLLVHLIRYHRQVVVMVVLIVMVVQEDQVAEEEVHHLHIQADLVILHQHLLRKDRMVEAVEVIHLLMLMLVAAVELQVQEKVFLEIIQEEALVEMVVLEHQLQLQDHL